ncbi:MAG: prenyltransferase/squalene oxidase repeat-containing protein [Candidatus Brocadiia bacterium]
MRRSRTCRVMSIVAAACLALPGLEAMAGGARLSAEQRKAAVARYDAALRQGAEWLLEQQDEKGTFGGPAAVGKTGLAVTALLSTPDAAKLREHPVVEKAVAYLVSMAQPDGSINTPGEKGLANYQTSAAVTALSLYDAEKYEEVRKRAVRYLVGIQHTEGAMAGGFGYNRDKRPDLSNTQFALEALKSGGMEEDSEAFQRCLKFLQRCQNRSESNDQPWATNDGGAIYYPGRSNAGVIQLPNGQVIYKSYGSMTYALLRGYILCGLEPDDPRVQAAQKWITEHYTLDANPGMENEKQGLYYYYLSMAKALGLLDKRTLRLPEGIQVNWAKDLGDRLVSLQRDEGYWVNEAMRWYENDKVLATSYVMIALSECRQALAEQP